MRAGSHRCSLAWGYHFPLPYRCVGALPVGDPWVADSASADCALRGHLARVDSGKSLLHYAGIWPVLAMINHSCSPNASVTVVGSSPSWAVVRAAKPIPSGSEILINYAGAVCLHAGFFVMQILQRRVPARSILMVWAWACACACSQPPASPCSHAGVHAGAPASQRRAALRAGFGFVCNCDPTAESQVC